LSILNIDHRVLFIPIPVTLLIKAIDAITISKKAQNNFTIFLNNVFF